MQATNKLAYFTFSCIFIILGLLFPYAGCRPLPESTEELIDQEQSETVITFFYLVNKSGQDIEVSVFADDQKLFVQKLGAQQDAPADIGEVPPPSPHPARELKIPLNRNAQQLQVEELNSGIQEKFEITDFIMNDAGFRITIEANQILLNQDYFPPQ
jgi:hypothetical protein